MNIISSSFENSFQWFRGGGSGGSIIISGKLSLLPNQMNRNGDYDRDRPPPPQLALFNARARLPTLIGRAKFAWRLRSAGSEPGEPGENYRPTIGE